MSKIKNKLIYLKNKWELKRYQNKEIDMYMHCNDKINIEEAWIERFDYVLAVAAHTIEKGLGGENIKPEFGVDKAKRLCELMLEYLSKGFPQHKFGFTEAYAVLNDYVRYKESVSEEITGVKDLYNKIKSLISDTVIYKSHKKIFEKEKMYCTEKISDFEQYLASCRTVNNYSNEPLKEEDILDALRLAAYAPCAYNRQPAKCYYTMNLQKIKCVDEVLPGNEIIKCKTPNYIIVTSKMTHFGVNEYNQWYVNGGIYIAYLRQALFMCNIGNFIYQWPITADEKKLRSLYAIPKYEVIIAVIGIGYLSEDVFCIEVQRKAAGDYIVPVG